MGHPLVEQVRQAGVVGAGGAGFPTHVKIAAKVDTYLVNGAECEPLLYKDKELMRLYAERLVDGLRQCMEATGATRGVVGIKAKYHDAIDALDPLVKAPLAFHRFDNFYPAGDEYVLVYEATGRLIPPAGIPLQVGCAVNNVETLLNVSLAAEGIPVTHKWLTVAGAVHRPSSFLVPVGITAREAIDIAGGPTVADAVAIEGGAMMGRPLPDLSAVVTKTTGGYIVLPRTHRLFQRKMAPESQKVRIARAACDQCSFCTELCPRYLLGYAIEPHKVMRSVGFVGERMEGWAQLGLLCCECSLCDLFSCPEDLPPKDMCVRSKAVWRAKATRPEPLVGLGRAHPMREGRRVPVPRLIQRLGLTAWDAPAPMHECNYEPTLVRLPLKQHVGAPALPVVAQGQSVRQGELVAEPPEGALGACIHASIDGCVSHVDERSIHISR